MIAGRAAASCGGNCEQTGLDGVETGQAHRPVASIAHKASIDWASVISTLLVRADYKHCKGARLSLPGQMANCNLLLHVFDHCFAPSAF